MDKHFAFLGSFMAALHQQTEGLKAGLVVLAEENDKTKKKFTEQKDQVAVSILSGTHVDMTCFLSFSFQKLKGEFQKVHADNKILADRLNRVVAFIDTGGSAPDPWGHSKDDKREIALSMLRQYLKIDTYNKWSLMLLKNCHYQAAITYLMYSDVPDCHDRQFASKFAHAFVDIQLSRRNIAYSCMGKNSDQ